MRTVKSFCVVAAVCLLTACGSGHIGGSQLNALQRGMTPEAVSQVVSSTPVEHLSMTVHGHPIQVQVYGVGPNADYLAYQHNQLLYWGSAGQFAASSDPLVRAIGRRTVSDMGVAASVKNNSDSDMSSSGY